MGPNNPIKHQNMIKIPTYREPKHNLKANIMMYINYITFVEPKKQQPQQVNIM